MYIDTTNSLLVQYGTIINSLLENQSKALGILNSNMDSLQDFLDRIVNSENHLGAHDKHLSAHDAHLKTCDAYLEIHDKYLSTHDSHLDALSQRIDLL
jgi:ABC-type transporter Mla subunit MlaD